MKDESKVDIMVQISDRYLFIYLQGATVQIQYITNLLVYAIQQSLSFARRSELSLGSTATIIPVSLCDENVQYEYPMYCKMLGVGRRSILTKKNVCKSLVEPCRSILV